MIVHIKQWPETHSEIWLLSRTRGISAEASYREEYFSEEKEGNSISKPKQVASTNTGQQKHQPLCAAVFFLRLKKGQTVHQM
jgi:hypothetical protein